jgi:predicted metallo-beta-lactamase superfamily hydrolase
MLGYSEKDIIDMRVAIATAKFYLPPSKSEFGEDLDKANDFLEGLQAEGRI